MPLFLFSVSYFFVVSQTGTEPVKPERPERQGVAGHSGSEGKPEKFRTSGRPGSTRDEKLFPGSVFPAVLENVMDSSDGNDFPSSVITENLENVMDINCVKDDDCNEQAICEGGKCVPPTSGKKQLIFNFDCPCKIIPFIRN